MVSIAIRQRARSVGPTLALEGGMTMPNQQIRVVFNPQPAPGPVLRIQFVAVIPDIPGLRLTAPTKDDLETQVHAELSNRGISYDRLVWEPSPHEL